MNKMRFLSIITMLALLLSFASLIPVSADEVCNSSGIPGITTDQDDYAPSGTVSISGSGFGCGQSLSVLVAAPDGSTFSAGGTGAPGPDVVTTNENGEFNLSYLLFGTLPDGTAYTGQEGQYTIQVLDAGGTMLASAAFSDSLGHNHTCALTAGGGAKCWGSNNYGQVGNNATSVRETTPVDVFGLTSGVAQISLGYFHTCVLTQAGGAKCWGFNPYGQLGDNTFSTRLAPVDVSTLASGVKQVVAGSYHTCALTDAGAVKCWGYNNRGQLGVSYIPNSKVPVDVVGLESGVIQLSLGYFHSCALTSTGAVKCWGYNNYGQLGNGSFAQSNVPVDVIGLSSGVAQISAGFSHTCALLETGATKCWGFNYYGQLGIGTRTLTSPFGFSTPVDVIGLANSTTLISAGGDSTCAVGEDGGASCWGDNRYGKLGDGTSVHATTPVGVTGLGSGVIQISTGGNHTCALTASGGAKCWGYNYTGQVGDGTIITRYYPTGVFGLTSGVAHLPDALPASNQPPAAEAGGPYLGAEGAPIALSGASASDPDGDPLAFNWSVDSALCSFDDASLLNPNLTCRDNGSFNLTLTMDDGANPPVSRTAAVSVSNVNPVGSLGNSGPITEGGSAEISFSGAFDPSSEDTAAGLHYAFDCSGGSLSGATYASSGASVSTSCTFNDNGLFTVSGKIMDKDGGSSEYTTQVTVNNAAPVLSPIHVDLVLVPVGTAVSASADFTDPGALDTHTAAWNWGEAVSPGTISETGGNGTASGSHVYSTPGVYTLSLVVTDKDGAPSNEAVYDFVVVYDPEGGFVTGGGWINSPAGAYFPDPCLEGKANFGFVSKYKKGASVPIGQTEFQFRAGDLNFHSSSYQWLVINHEGTNAQFKGEGTINQALAPNGSPYKFMIWATDQDPAADTFRIKIWYEDGAEIVVYDNGFNQPIGGGSIQVHTH